MMRSSRGRAPLTLRFTVLSALAGLAAIVVVAPTRTVAGRTGLVAQGAQTGDTGTLVLPPKDPTLQRALERALNDTRFRKLVRAKALSVALVDLTTPGAIRYAGVDDDHMRYAASLPKIAILLGVFDAVERGEVDYTPDLREKMERMIRRSENPVSTELLELVGFEAIAQTLEDPRYELYGPDRNGGLWVGRDYGSGQGLWERDSLHNISHGATARQVARFFVMLERGQLVSPWASGEMKSIMGDPELHHKFVKGLDRWPTANVYRKSGTWQRWHADAALVEREGKKYVAVALLESSSGGGIFPDLIVRLDALIRAPREGRTARGE